MARQMASVPRTPAGVRGTAALTASNRLPAGRSRRTIGSTTVPGLEDQHAWTIITSANYKRNYILKSKP